MKKKRIWGLLIGMLISSHGMAQLGDYDVMIDTLLIKDPVSGFLWWKPNTFIPGQCFQQYRIISGDTANNAILDKSWVDATISMKHYRFQQTYKGIPVEAAYAIEHFSASDKLIITNAKFAIELDMTVTPYYSESAAKQELMDYFPTQWVMAWDDTDWENEMQSEMGSGATWEPTGELMLAVDNYKDLGFYIAGSRYRLAYKFDVMVVSPSRVYSSYFVDAQTGEVFKEQPLDYHDGDANIIHAPGGPFHSIDTRERGWPNNDWVLETDNDEKKIHTKYYSDNPWTIRGEIDKDDEPWNAVHQHATSAHWYARQSWLYFKNIKSLDGMDGDNGRIRIHIDEPRPGHDSYYNKTPYANNMTFSIFSGRSTGEYHDVVSHEFTHGVIKHSSDLANEWEPGALGESFCDIFGSLAERISWGGDLDTDPNWQMGHSEIWIRNLNDPKSAGEHRVYDGGCIVYSGQPDTYQGEYWNESDCDFGNIHAKSGVQNFWFYLLTAGGAGENDNTDYYDLSGIGAAKASKITYHNMTDYMTPGAQYSDAREGAIACAKLFYGECSDAHVQTAYAWYAVGVGEPLDCEWVVSLDEEADLGNLSIYPNPIEHSFIVDWNTYEQFDIVVYDMNGKQLLTLSDITNHNQIVLPEIARGIYILEVKHGDDILRKRIVKK
ncbi:MAG: T9SS type A sorting domain-containing protein [Crocinitomix sp.]|nr:T9SS type A sorting domain-containing protein [Crocinitomix sp.]